MKTKIVRLTMFICLGSAVTSLYAIPSEKQFDGEWGSHKGLDFGIHLHQNGNRLTGYHSGVTKNGSRTDGPVEGEDPPSITGTIEGNTAISSKFTSAYPDAVLKYVTLHDRSLDWKVIEVKQSGELLHSRQGNPKQGQLGPKKGWVRDW